MAQPEQGPPKYSFKAHWEKDGRIGVVGAVVRPDGGVHLLQDFIDPPQRTEQEPVAWVSEDVCEGQYIDGRPRKIWWECENGVGTAFYTRPQRTWVGLTDDDRFELWLKTESEDVDRYSFAKAIEAKLKEKNT